MRRRRANALMVLMVLALTTSATACWPTEIPPPCPDPLFAAAGGNPCPEPPPLPPPPGDCVTCGSAFGDPRLSTFDRHFYAFQGVGEYTLVVSDGLEVQSRFVALGPTLSNTAALGVRVDDGMASIEHVGDTRVRVRIDGDEVDLPAEGLPVGDGVIGPSGDDIVIGWPDGSVLHVIVRTSFIDVYLFLTGERAGAASGLLGDFDGDPSNDFVGRDGTAYDQATITFDELYGDYGESWRITDETSLLPYGDGETTETFTDRSLPEAPFSLDDLTPEQLAFGEEQCAPIAGGPQRLYEACVGDVGATFDEAYAESHLRFSEQVGGEVADPIDPIGAGAETVWLTAVDDVRPITGGRGHLVPLGGDLVVGQFGDGRRASLYAFDTGDGSLQWQVDDVVAGCPATMVDQDTLLVLGLDPVGLELVGPDGDVSRVGDVDDREFEFGCGSGFVIRDDVAIGTSAGGAATVAYDLDDGNELWRIDHERRAAESIVDLDDGVLVAEELGDAESVLLTLLDPRTGQRLASEEFAGTSVVVDGRGDAVVLTSFDIETLDTSVFGFTVSAAGIDPRWRREADPSGTGNGPLLAFTVGDEIVVGSQDAAIAGFDLDTGDRLWSIGSGDVFPDNVGPLVVDDDRTYATSRGTAALRIIERDGSFSATTEDELFDSGRQLFGLLAPGMVTDALAVFAAETTEGVVVVGVRT